MAFPLLAAGAGLMGNIVGGLFGASAQDSANAANVGIANLNRDFQNELTRSAHQRETRDLREAGLNPVLSANGGAPMAAGSGATVEASNPMSGIGPGIASAMEMANASEDLKNKEATRLATVAQANASQAQAENSRVNAMATQAEMPSIMARASTAMTEGQARAAESRLKKQQAEADSQYVDFDSKASRIYQGIGAATDAVSLKNLLLGGKLRGRRGPSSGDLEKAGASGVPVDKGGRTLPPFDWKTGRFSK